MYYRPKCDKDVPTSVCGECGTGGSDPRSLLDMERFTQWFDDPEPNHNQRGEEIPKEQKSGRPIRPRHPPPKSPLGPRRGCHYPSI
jgi:hypothetical protein